MLPEDPPNFPTVPIVFLPQFSHKPSQIWMDVRELEYCQPGVISITYVVAREPEWIRSLGHGSAIARRCGQHSHIPQYTDDVLVVISLWIRDVELQATISQDMLQPLETLRQLKANFIVIQAAQKGMIMRMQSNFVPACHQRTNFLRFQPEPAP